MMHSHDELSQLHQDLDDLLEICGLTDSSSVQTDSASGWADATNSWAGLGSWTEPRPPTHEAEAAMPQHLDVRAHQDLTPMGAAQR